MIERRVVMAALAIMLPLAACATSEPINLSTQFTPPSSNWSPAGAQSGKAAAGVCRIHFANVTDARSDTQSMGTMGTRAVLISDSVAWLRSGLLSLSRDPRLQIADDSSALVLNVELIKAYEESKTTDRASNVVIGVIYPAGEKKFYRGSDASLNWSNSSGETQSGLDSALAGALQELDRDLTGRCKPI